MLPSHHTRQQFLSSFKQTWPRACDLRVNHLANSSCRHSVIDYASIYDHCWPLVCNVHQPPDYNTINHWEAVTVQIYIIASETLVCCKTPTPSKEPLIHTSLNNLQKASYLEVKLPDRTLHLLLSAPLVKPPHILKLLEVKRHQDSKSSVGEEH